jgi:hypothetical protein
MDRAGPLFVSAPPDGVLRTSPNRQAHEVFHLVRANGAWFIVCRAHTKSYTLAINDKGPPREVVSTENMQSDGWEGLELESPIEGAYTFISSRRWGVVLACVTENGKLTTTTNKHAPGWEGFVFELINYVDRSFFIRKYGLVGGPAHSLLGGHISLQGYLSFLKPGTVCFRSGLTAQQKFIYKDGILTCKGQSSSSLFPISSCLICHTGLRSSL